MTRNHVGVFVERLTTRWRQTARLEATWLGTSPDLGDAELRALGLGDF